MSSTFPRFLPIPLAGEASVTPEEQSVSMTATITYLPNPSASQPQSATTLATAALRRPPNQTLSAEVYWRRRLVLLTVALSLIIGLWAFTSPTDSSTQTGHDKATQVVETMPFDAVVVVVQPGDTLWRIATELNPSADPRRLVDALSDIAGSPTIQPGQQLVIPTNLLE